MLRDFILAESSIVPPSAISNLLSATFSVYKQFKHTLPTQHPTIREQPVIDRVRACPATETSASYFDTVLVHAGDSADIPVTSLHGKASSF